MIECQEIPEGLADYLHRSRRLSSLLDLGIFRQVRDIEKEHIRERSMDNRIVPTLG